MSFIDKSFETRLNEYNTIKNKYPDRFPIIVEKDKLTKMESIDKNKYLVDKNMVFCQFINIIRKRLKIKPQDAIFITINGQLAPSNELMCNIYKNMKSDDGFLYLKYSMENTFG
tara:strand:- start:4063 stop:4404 length:342 start_codon:yes stop_codon:yes gene_type:complete